MSVVLGANWVIHHLTDRTVELRKESAVYRRFTDRDGFVLVRAEPGMDRAAMIEKAYQMARKNDEALALRVTQQLLPTGRALADYRQQQASLAPRFATRDEEPTQKVYRP